MMTFYKVLMGDFSKNMSIPENFIHQFNEEISESVKLKGPSGLIWHVGLTKVAGDVFLQYGWKEFVDAHYLKENDLLIFKYDGNSCFTVLTFDPSGCEKESSYFVETKVSRKRETKEDSLEILEVSSPCKVHNGNPSIYLPGKMPQKPMRSICYKSPRGNKVQMAGSRGGIRDRNAAERPSLAYAKSYKSRRRPVTDAEKDRVLQLARSFQLAKPAFLSVMKSYNVYKGFQLWIKPEFARSYLPHRKEKIILHLPNGKKEWVVSYLYNSYKFVGNWRSFSVDNNLEEGDVCIFELTGDMNCTAMTVHIFRVLKEVVPLIPTA